MSKYNDDSIQKLTGREHVRLRPLMYIETTETPLPLLIEIIDNSLDELLSIRGKGIIDVILNLDENIYTVVDSGRGIPFSKKVKGENVPGIILVATDLFAGAKFKKDQESSYTISAGLHGVGLTVVNYLSTWLQIISRRDKQEAIAEFVNSEVKNFTVTSIQGEYKRGTTVSFKPDKSIFTDIAINPDEIRKYCKTVLIESDIRERVNINLTIIQNKQTTTEKITSDITELEEFKNCENIIEFFCQSPNGHEELYIAFSYLPDRDVKTFGLVNLKPVHQGNHITFAKTLVVDVMNEILDKYIKNPQITRYDLQYGLRLFVSVKLIKTEFQGQSKNVLKTPVSYIKSAFNGELEEFSKLVMKPKNLSFLRKVVEHLDNYKKKIQNKTSLDTFITADAKNSYSRGTVDIDNLFDCLKPGKEDTELYICEGSSAGGTLLKIRNRDLHGVLLLRGKTVNSLQESKEISELVKNREVASILKSVGIDPKKGFDENKIRYERILLISDPDPDGGHISLLVLSIFAKFMPEVLKKGYIYYCEIPLFMFYQKDKMIPAYTKTDALKLMQTYPKFTRFKGLGEMDEKEFEYCIINKNTRKIKRLFCSDEDIMYLKDVMTDINVKRKVLFGEN